MLSYDPAAQIAVLPVQVVEEHVEVLRMNHQDSVRQRNLVQGSDAGQHHHGR